MASIQAIKGKKGTTYRVEAMIDGFRHSKTFKKKSEAEKHAAILIIESETASGLNYRFSQTTTLSELIADYLNNYRGKDTSRQQRVSFWSDELGHLPIAKVTKVSVRTVLQRLLSNGRSNATHNRYKAALSAVFRYADEQYGSEHNPCRGIRNKPESQPVDWQGLAGV
jgi:integrase